MYSYSNGEKQPPNLAAKTNIAVKPYTQTYMHNTHTHVVHTMQKTHSQAPKNFPFLKPF